MGPCVVFMSVRVCSWASMSVDWPSCRIHGPRAVFVSIGGPLCHVGGRSCPLVDVCVHWWAFVSVGGCSSWRHGWCDIGPVSHVKEEEGRRGVVGLTCMHNA